MPALVCSLSLEQQDPPSMNMHVPPSASRGLARLGIVCMVLLFGSTVVYSESDGDFIKSITAGERALLPEWCLDTQTFGYGDAWHNTSPRAGHWIKLMGQSFWASHHYCWGLVKMQRSSSVSYPPHMRTYYLQSAIDEMNYVVRNATPDYPLMPEVLTRMGECYVRQENYSAAYEIFEKARGLKPDYWPPYVRWAEVLMKFGKRQQALDLVDAVMKLAPDDAELQRQYGLLKSTPSRTAKGVAGGALTRQRTSSQKPVSVVTPGPAGASAAGR
jgi:tetratricopeptide (TPR) repeat protein